MNTLNGSAKVVTKSAKVFITSAYTDPNPITVAVFTTSGFPVETFDNIKATPIIRMSAHDGR